jgi:uncharacterized membrane protein YcaP (DUF421 family)
VAVIPVVRAIAVYVFLLLLMRVMGKRTLAEITSFDFIVLLIVSECTQQAMSGNDFSVTNAAILVLTLVLLQRGSDWLAKRSFRADKLLNDLPVVIVEDGRPVDEWIRRNGLNEGEILEEARRSQGIGSMDEIRYAVLERNGGISVIPRS